MIRTAYPITPPPFWRHFELAARHTRQALSRRRDDLRLRDRVSTSSTDVIQNVQTVCDAPPLRERHDAFVIRYEGLVDVLCAAAHHGSTPDLEAEYTEYRAWLARHYGEVKPYLRTFLSVTEIRPDFADLENGGYPQNRRFSGQITYGMLPVADAFESLFLPANLTLMLTNDNGRLIDLLLETQNALDAWTQTLLLPAAP